MIAGKFLVAALAGLAGSVSPAQRSDPPAAPPIADPAATANDAAIALGDESQRMTVPVQIAQHGPFDFIIDTGAERTVVSRELAAQLSLATGRPVRVTAMANIANVGTAIIPGLSVSKIAHTTIEAPMLEARNLGAPGMLGIDALQGHSVGIDFDRNRMTLTPSKKRRVAYHPEDIVVRAKNLFGQLIVTDARYRGKRISVVVDTGSQVTVANEALRRILKKPPAEMGKIALLSATGAWLNADYGVVDRLEIAGIQFQNVRIAFAEAMPFARFKLSDTPALLLGMDSLRLFRRVSIDFANREVRFTLPRGAGSSDPGIIGFGAG